MRERTEREREKERKRERHIYVGMKEQPLRRNRTRKTITVRT